jgi:hypothetical protein
MSKGLDYAISLTDKGFGTGINKAKTQTNGLDSALKTSQASIGKMTAAGKAGFMSMGAAAKSLMATMAPLLAGTAIIGFVKSSTAAYDKQAKAEASLQATLKSTGAVAGKTFGDLTAMASELQKKTLFGDEETIGAQSLLLTFTKVRGAIYDKAIPAIQDMATKMAGDGPADLKGATIQIGKALNDPIKGISALSKAGIQFSDSQKSMIESMVKSGDIAKAQEVILKELETQFGGSAEAAAKAGMGPMKQFTNSLGDATEEIGAALMPVLNSLASIMGAVVVPAVSGLASAIKFTFDLVSNNKATFAVITAGVMAFAVAMNAAKIATMASTVATGIQTAAQWALNVAMGANPIGAVILALTALAAAITIAWNHSETFRGVLYATWEVIKQIGSNIWEMLIEPFEAVGDVVSGIVDAFSGGGFDKLQDGIKRLGSSLLTFMLQPVMAIAKGIDAIAGTSLAKSLADATGMKDLTKDVGKAAAKGFDEGVKSFKDEKLQEATKGKKSAFPTGGVAAMGAPQDEAAMAGLKESASAGRSVRNVTVNVTKLVEQLNIHTTNIKEGAQDIKKQIEEVFVAMVRDAELAL